MMLRGRVVRAASIIRRIVTATPTPPPKRLGVTHWSTRLLATKLGISTTAVARA